MKSGAERMREFRARKKERGEKYSRGRSGRADNQKSKWKYGEFIALDGEGESVGEIEKFKVGNDGKEYECKDHRYTLLAASTGEYIHAKGERLETAACLDFLVNLAVSHPKAIFVIFAGSYDINHILMYGFERELLQKISRGETVEVEFDGIKYSLEYRARKSLLIRRGLTFVQNSKGKTVAKWAARICIWDVFGFFQDNFVTVIDKWLGKEWKHYDLIKKMKALRGDFANIAQQEINAYNAAELESLVCIMEKVRDAINGLDLVCRRWDGAGALAASFMRKHNIKEFKKNTDDLIITAVRIAYAGGRIEVCKIGYHGGPVYDYDVNSAYPAVMAELPCMLHGFWERGEGEPPPGFTLVRCKYEFMQGLRFYPLFFRTDKMQISFPAQGEGWYWYPEYLAATKCEGHLEVIEWYHWKQSCNHKPFHWIENYYKTRQQWVKNPLEEWQQGGEKIIKLGLNSLYGKTAQQIGGKKDSAPVYHQLEWAGYITSATRARLYEAANRDPNSIIGFATDGIFSTKELDIEISREKKMGAWELKEPVPEGMVIAMAGVYWWIYGENKYTHFSRGFDKESMKTPDKIMQAWKQGKDCIDIPMHRLIGMGSACASDTLYKMRGRFTEGVRTLRLDGKSHKRVAIDVKKNKPHKGLVDLEPSMNIEYGYGLQEISFPYPILWLDGSLTDDFKNELELQAENSDTENI